MIYPVCALCQKTKMAVVLLLISVFVLPVMALPPAIEADKLLLSAAGKLDSEAYDAAARDLEKIRALKVKLPVDYYFQYGRYLASTQNVVEAKKNLETYLQKAGKEGEFYDSALKLYSYVEENEKRWGRFKYNGDGTVTDTETGLMWAAKDNGYDINWQNARAYCRNYNGGGHTDWRLPTYNELAGLYSPNSKNRHGYRITPLIDISRACLWASETRGSEAAAFGFRSGHPGWIPWIRQSLSGYYRTLPVRSGK